MKKTYPVDAGGGGVTAERAFSSACDKYEFPWTAGPVSCLSASLAFKIASLRTGSNFHKYLEILVNQN